MSEALLHPRSLTASCIGEEAVRVMRGSSKGAVHGVYGGAVNIKVGGRIVCVVPQRSPRGPTNINVSVPRASPMTSFGLEVGDEVKMVGSRIKIGSGVAVSLALAARYSPNHRFASPIASNWQISANIREALRTGAALGRPGGLGELMLARRDFGLFAVAGRKRLDRLTEAIGRRDPAAIERGVRDMVGLGPGLTPSSDDVLAGMVLVMVIYSENCGRSGGPDAALARAVVSQSDGRTTALSQEFLEEAAAGNGNEIVMALCEAIFTGGPAEVEREAMRLLGMGETSGTDTLLGMVIGARLCLGLGAMSWRGSRW